MADITAIYIAREAIGRATRRRLASPFRREANLNDCRTTLIINIQLWPTRRRFRLISAACRWPLMPRARFLRFWKRATRRFMTGTRLLLRAFKNFSKAAWHRCRDSGRQHILWAMATPPPVRAADAASMLRFSFFLHGAPAMLPEFSPPPPRIMPNTMRDRGHTNIGTMKHARRRWP